MLATGFSYIGGELVKGMRERAGVPLHGHQHPATTETENDAMGHRRTSTTERYISRFDGEQADQRVRAAMSS